MKRAVGIDIGSHSVKLIEIDAKKGHSVLTKCVMVKVKNNDKASALKELLAQAKLTTKRVNVSLSGPSVIVRYIEMPPMRIGELKSAIKFEAEKYIPFNINESTVDCAVLGGAVLGSQQRVLLVVAKKQDVDESCRMFREFGLEINVVDVDSFAFFNSFENSGARVKKEDQAYALINLGAKFSNMNIAVKDSLYFTRDIFWGGNDINKRLSDIKAISEDGAEALKLKPGENRGDIVEAVTPALEKLTQQIRMSLDYFETQFGKDVEKIYISGGTSYLFNMVDFLKENLRVDVIMWNPFEHMVLSEVSKEIDAQPALFAVAAGLALRT
ncbi:MAG: pilus assembly protein PilM [Candidatus Omnitrophica bacterium]|nr:pilus assembly protein PilM [Candidatus Omnitrophota bacterium]